MLCRPAEATGRASASVSASSPPKAPSPPENAVSGSKRSRSARSRRSAPCSASSSATGEAEIILTTTTSTGYRLAKERYADVASAIGIFPADLWPCSALAWNRIRPDVVILVEGELWPEHLAQRAPAACRPSSSTAASPTSPSPAISAS
jgi:hypothetical protein